MTYYDFLKGIQEELEDKIVDFFEDRIKGHFPDSDCKYTFVVIAFEPILPQVGPQEE
jgi:hypothetical protein